MNIAILSNVIRVVGETIKIVNEFGKWRKEALSKRGGLYGGNWNNQGQIKNRPTHYIDMDGCYSRNKLIGQFNVCKSDDQNSWEILTIKGKRRFSILKCNVYRIVDEEEILLATGILKKDPKGIRWILKESDTDQFPQEAVLRRGLPKIG